MSGKTAVELSRRRDGVRLDQGASFILLNRAEAVQLVHDIQAMIATADTCKSTPTTS